MSSFLQTTAALMLSLTLPGTLLLAVLTLAGVLPVPAFRPARGPRRIAVVVPVHDEQGGIARTVANLRADADALPGTRAEVVVVADNCSDDTAAVARRAGARVLERRDPARRGKGYALDFAFATLLRERFDAFVVVDADSEVDPGFLVAMRNALAAGADAAQAAYLPLGEPRDARARLVRLARVAWNVLRLRGRERLGLSVGILGNGFALSRQTLLAVPYTARSIVEDVEYHASLVRAGRRVRFVAAATVRGDMPAGGAALSSQRARWEGGRLRLLASQALPMLREVAAGRLRMLDPLADLLLAPLAWHAALLGAAAFVGEGAVRWAAFGSIAILAAHVGVAFAIGGCGWRDAAALAGAPLYVLRKLAGAAGVLRAARAGTPWVRTAREGTR